MTPDINTNIKLNINYQLLTRHLKVSLALLWRFSLTYKFIPVEKICLDGSKEEFITSEAQENYNSFYVIYADENKY